MKFSSNQPLSFFLLLLSFQSSQGQPAFPVKISENKRYLVDQQNNPFPILGRTAWFAISLTEDGYKKFLANSIAHGCNAIEVSVMTHWPMGNHAPFNGRGDIPFVKRLNGADWDGRLDYNQISTEAPDLLTPNEKYWSYIDQFLSYCESQGILVFMFPAYVGYDGKEQGWMQELLANGVEKTEAYGAWIANRFSKKKNLVWMLLGDMGKFTPDQINAEAALIRGLKSVHGQSTEYSAEASSGMNAADQPDFGKEMTLNGSYSWELKVPVPFIARKAYHHSPTMPSFLLEEPYDEEGPDGNNYNPNAIQPVRRFEWWGWLSTIGGYIAGNAYIWQFVDSVWPHHLNTQAALDMSRLNVFIKSISWWELAPSGMNGMKTLIMEKDNMDTSASYVSAAASPKGDLLVAYIPPAHRGGITVDMSIFKEKVYGRWFDPTNGRYSLVSSPAVNNVGSQIFSPPEKNAAGDRDWVLVLTSKKP
jgi:hypothetical protein